MRLRLALFASFLALSACAQDGRRAAPAQRAPVAAPRVASAHADSTPIAGADLSLPIPPPMEDRPPSAAGAPPARVASGPYADEDTAALPRAVADVAAPRPWKVIVLHHSAGEVGGEARFDEMHRAKGWDGVGYDFVIGNGSETKDGEIETTPRWTQQKDGAHVKGWNDVSIGICLVGNFENTDPTPKQMDALVRLVRHLRRRFHVPAERVVGHGTLGPTLCPGKRLSVPDVVAKSAPDGAPRGSPAGARAP